MTPPIRLFPLILKRISAGSTMESNLYRNLCLSVVWVLWFQRDKKYKGSLLLWCEYLKMTRNGEGEKYIFHLKWPMSTFQTNTVVKTDMASSQYLELGDLCHACITVPESCGTQGGTISVWFKMVDCSSNGGAIITIFSQPQTSFLVGCFPNKIRYVLSRDERVTICRIQDFPEEGAPTPESANILPFFCQKLHENERI